MANADTVYKITSTVTSKILGGNDNRERRRTTVKLYNGGSSL